MAGIEVHTASPINPNTAPKSQEQTAAPTATQNAPAYNAALTTAYSMNTAQTARPGAPAVPAPTTAAAASVYTPPTPTRTTSVPAPNGPPPPQPGQAPQPFTERSDVPSPPQAHTQAVTPIRTQAVQPTVVGMSQDLSHPPGYVQNSHASFDDRWQEPQNLTHTPNPLNTDSSPIWDTAMSWAKEAGRKLSVVEGEVWKKINGDK